MTDAIKTWGTNEAVSAAERNILSLSEQEGHPLYLGSNESDYWTVTATTVDHDSDSWGFSPEADTGEVRWPIGVLLTTLTVLIALGNSFVVLAVLLERQLRTFENFFFASLAVADLSIALFVLPLSLSIELSDGLWHFGRGACNFFIFVDVSCCTASILHLCTIGLNRYWSISCPLKYATKQTNRRAFLMIVSVWMLSFVIASPPIFGWPKRTNSITDQCTYDEDRLYVICSAAWSFYFPLIVMIIVYYKIYRFSKRGAEFRSFQPCGNEVKTGGSSPRPGLGVSNSRDLSDRSQGLARLHIADSSSFELVRAPSSTPGHHRCRDRPHNMVWSLVCRAAARRRGRKSGMRLAEVKTAKTLGLIMTVFVVCWLPFFLLYVIKPFCPRCYIPVALDRSALWLGYANSLLNPIIYICCKPLFRCTFKKILLLDYCRLASRYTLHVQCCPTHRPQHHARCRRRRHIVDSDSSVSHRAEYGHLSAKVPPEVLHEDDMICHVIPKAANEASGQRSWTSSGRDGARCSGSIRSPPSADWSSFDAVIKRVPNACVSDIPKKTISSKDDCQEFQHPKTTGNPEVSLPRTQAADQRWCTYTSTTLQGIKDELNRDSRAHHQPRPRTDPRNSDFSQRVQILNRWSTCSEPMSWRPYSNSCCSDTTSREEANVRSHHSNSLDYGHGLLSPPEASGTHGAFVGGMQKENWLNKGTTRSSCEGVGLREMTRVESDHNKAHCNGRNETML